MPTEIRSQKLTTCYVAKDGSNVRLEFLDRAGATVAIELPFDQAEAVVMTLPHLLSGAIRRQTGNDEARYVFGLHGWRVEKVEEEQCLILTLITADGFEVCFAIPREACRSLAWILQVGADAAVGAGDGAGDGAAVGNGATAAGRVKLN